MRIIRLPRQLPPLSELLSLNRLLHANAISLDWSDVQVVTPEQLDTLLHGLTLSDHIEYIDSGDDPTISDALSPLIMEAFARIDNDADVTASRPIRTVSQTLAPPVIWTPESENEAESTIIRKLFPIPGQSLDSQTQTLVETRSNDPASADRSSPRFVPVYEISCDEANTISILSQPYLDMRELSHTDTRQLPTLLQPLVDAYATWIEGQTKDSSHPRAVQNRRAVLQRIQDSMSLISTDQNAAEAFTFMNRAMWLQRIRTLWLQEEGYSRTRRMNDIDQPANRSWHPFELAFILLNIAALIDPHAIDRNATKGALADLRWFPAGGRTTKAYLGLAAYTLGLRRLQDRAEERTGGSGVAAILRYTSCTLTPQQFQSAATLICIGEIIRRADDSTWGTTPFRLGLQSDPRSATNATIGVARIINQAQSAHNNTYDTYATHDRILSLLNRCPWCGSPIETTRDTSARASKGRTIIYCRDPKNECSFSSIRSKGEGLPILVTDENVYYLKPALLIAVETW